MKLLQKWMNSKENSLCVFDISVAPRLMVHSGITLLVISQTNMRLDYISDIAGLGALNFGLFAPIITILAVIGAINAFNMVDGIDGLLGGLAIITFTGIVIPPFQVAKITRLSRCL